MSDTPRQASQQDAGEQLKALLQRNERVKERLIRHRHDLETTEKDLEAAREEARNAYGTDDLGALRELYRQQQAENVEALKRFEAAIVEAEQLEAETTARLKQVEQAG